MTPDELKDLVTAVATATTTATVDAHKKIKKLDKAEAKADAEKREKDIKDYRKSLTQSLKDAGLTDEADIKLRVEAAIAKKFPPVASAAPGTPLPPPVAPAAAPVAGEVERFNTPSYRGVVRGTDIVISNKPATGAPIVHQVTLAAWDAAVAIAVARGSNVDAVAAQVIASGSLVAPKSKSIVGRAWSALTF